MTEWIANAGMWLLQAVPPDTVLMREVGSDPSWFDRVTGVASGLISVALLVLTVALVPAAWNFRKSYGKINRLLEKVYGDVNPLMRSASAIADDVNYITTSLRVDVQQVNRTVASANERLQKAMDATEQRVEELNSLLRMIQEEAEDIFVSTASALRGVRGGAAALQDGAEDADMLDDEDWDEALDDALEAEEAFDGNDSEITARNARSTPRIRPRPGDRSGP